LDLSIAVDLGGTGKGDSNKSSTKKCFVKNSKSNDENPEEMKIG